MPWCPKCKEEYREGITVCAECGETLVEELEEPEAVEENYEEAAEETEDAAVSDEEPADYDWDEEKAAVTGDEEDSEDDEEESEEGEQVEILNKQGKMYVKKADEYKDLIGTGYTFVILSVLGLVYLVLCQVGVIPISYNILALIVLTAMFLLFIIIGISSFVKAKSIKGLIGSEEEESKEISEWLKQNASKERLEAMRQEEESEEEYYLNVTEWLKEELKEEYPEAESSYLELLIEEYYTEIFEDALEEE